MSEFESWLGAQLKALETDDEVYLPYIVSILEDEDDKSGAIDDLLSGISDKEAENKALRIQILERWDRLQGGVGEGEPEVDGKLDHAHYIHLLAGSSCSSSSPSPLLLSLPSLLPHQVKQLT